MRMRAFFKCTAFPRTEKGDEQRGHSLTYDVCNLFLFFDPPLVERRGIESTLYSMLFPSYFTPQCQVQIP